MSRLGTFPQFRGDRVPIHSGQADVQKHCCRAELSRDFQTRRPGMRNTHVMADNRQIQEAVRCGLRKHVLGKPPEKARLLVEIWAEAGRNPRVAAMTRAIDAEVLARLEALIDAAKAGGAASPQLDSRFGARFLFTFVAGLFKRIALEPDFDPAAEGPMATGVCKALFAGALTPEPSAQITEVR